MEKISKSKIMFGALALVTLTSCSLFHPTPILAKSYEAINFKSKKASHEEFSRFHINENWSYNSGFYHGDKVGHYFHLYKDNELVYNFEYNDSVFVDKVVYKNNKIYFALTQSDKESKRGFVTTINSLDESFKYEKIYEDNMLLSNFIFEDSIYFISSTSYDSNAKKVVELSYEGEVINEFVPSSLNGNLNTLIYAKDNLVLGAFNEEYHFYLFDKEGKFKEKIASVKNMNIKRIEYKNDELYLLGYEEEFTNFDLSKFHIYEYKNKTLTTLFSIEMPSDYSYHNSIFEEYKDNFYGVFSVAVNDASKSLYSRKVILQFNKLASSIKTIYLDKNVYIAFYDDNGHIYLGNYFNDKYVDNEATGEFFDIDLN